MLWARGARPEQGSHAAAGVQASARPHPASHRPFSDSSWSATLRGAPPHPSPLRLRRGMPGKQPPNAVSPDLVKCREPRKCDLRAPGRGGRGSSGPRVERPNADGALGTTCGWPVGSSSGDGSALILLRWQDLRGPGLLPGEGPAGRRSRWPAGWTTGPQRGGVRVRGGVQQRGGVQLRGHRPRRGTSCSVHKRGQDGSQGPVRARGEPHTGNGRRHVRPVTPVTLAPPTAPGTWAGPACSLGGFLNPAR